MRLKYFLSVVKLALLLGGISFCILSLFAVQFGIDNDAGWGKGRIRLLLIGLLLLIATLMIHFHAQVNKF